jgi:hypothetical protein
MSGPAFSILELAAKHNGDRFLKDPPATLPELETFHGIRLL